MHDAGAGFGQQVEVFGLHLRHVDRDQLWAREPQRGQPRERPFAAGLQALLDLDRGLVQVHRDR